MPPAAATTAAGSAVQARAGLGSVDLTLCVLYLLSVLCVGFYFTLKERRDRAQFRQARLRRSLKLDSSNDNSKPRHESARNNQQHSSAKTATPAPGANATDHGVDDEALEEYYLGGRRIPWWALGVADVSSYIDISGTMINTALVYALGVKGMYIEIRGGLCLFLAFQLAYTGKLSRRCPVKTRGEWIKFRFGDCRDGVLLRTTIAFTSMMNGILAVTYFAVGGGKFFTEFVHVPSWLGLPSEFWAALGLMLVAMLYTVASGFTTVVYTDVYQSLFIFASFAVVAVMGVATSLPEQFAVFVPLAQSPSDGLSHVFQTTSGPAGTHSGPSVLKILYTKSAWVSALPPAHLDLPPETAYAMYNSFGVVLGTYVLLQTMRSASGPGGSGLQSVLATKSEKDVRSQTFLAMLLLSLRWAFSAGVAVLAIRYSVDHATVPLDPERVVPVVIDQMLPVGVKGFVLAALLAAALTTFDTTIHSASAYWTVDIYHALVNPQASAQQLVWHARGATLVVLLAGALLSLHVDTINRIWGFMTIALAGGFVWPFVFSWYWARFNAYSCLSGVLAGFVAAFATFIFAPLLPELTAFAITSSVSCVASVVCCLCTRPVSDHVLRRFYRFARPPGAWSAVKRVCFSDDTIGAIDRENRRDLACTGLIALVQLAVYLLAVSVVARAWMQSLVLLVVVAGLSPLIYTKWYAQLQDRPVGLKSDLTAGLLEE